MMDSSPAFEIRTCPCDEWTLEVPWPAWAWAEDVDLAFREHVFECLTLEAMVSAAGIKL